LRGEAESLLAQEAGVVREALDKADAEAVADFERWRRENPPTEGTSGAAGARYQPNSRIQVGGGSQRNGGLRLWMSAWCLV
jgi:hypothetical protein